MSVIIHGLDMPDGCHHCRFSYLDKGETNGGEPCTVLMCSAINQGTNGAEYDGNRPSWCPLVPLPEGHGNLIDLDEVLLDIDCTGTNKFGMLDEDIRTFLRRYKPVVPAEGGTDDGD